MHSSIVKPPSKQEIEKLEVKKKPVSTEKIESPPKPKETESRIKVFIRKRPLLHSEMGKNDLISVPNPVKIYFFQKKPKNNIFRSLKIKTSLLINDGTNIITSSFDGVFSEKANQMQIFDMLKPSLESAFLGYNLSVFAYGQTGSGVVF